MKISIDTARIWNQLETLASFSAIPSPAVTRVVYSDEDRQARRWFKQLCLDAELSVREDAVGNTFARWKGANPELPAVSTGSHIDAIPHSGRFDGTVGVLGGLEAIRALQDAGLVPRRSLELILFTSEEPTRFGIGCLGSRMMAGSLNAADAGRLVDSEGRNLDSLRESAGYAGELQNVAIPTTAYAAFLELHIEQGPLLEQRGVPLGVVTAIAAPASFRIKIQGQGGHAGAVLMPDRHDAFLAAAELALRLEAAARSTGSVDSVATNGVCNVFPGAINSIPSAVHLEADIRDTDIERRDRIVDQFEQACKDIARQRGVQIDLETINRDAPATCAASAVDALSKACETHGLPFDRMVSRAYHDSLFMSRICPAAMLFIPCENGVSHRPDEYASAPDIARGTLVLAEALASLSIAP